MNEEYWARILYHTLTEDQIRSLVVHTLLGASIGISFWGVKTILRY